MWVLIGQGSKKIHLWSVHSKFKPKHSSTVEAKMFKCTGQSGISLIFTVAGWVGPGSHRNNATEEWGATQTHEENPSI